MRPAIFDSSLSREFSIGELIKLFQEKGVSRLYYKCLAPNDNSKNQPYMAGHITDLGFLPTGDIHESISVSRKPKNPKREVKFSADLTLYWLSSEGNSYPAPNAKLIYYPQYPEVRLSGFLKGAPIDSGGWMEPRKRGRQLGRVLFLGVKDYKEIYAYLALPESRISKEIDDVASVGFGSVFREIAVGRSKGDSKEILINELKRIHLNGWIDSKRLTSDGSVIAYEAPNGGGTTLEAELGILPNGDAKPDFLGWEVKQFGVKRFGVKFSKVLTVMTPEPDGGYYVDGGVNAFVRKYGYADNKGREGRFNFNGKHLAGVPSEKTGLELVVVGYDASSNTLVDSSGYVGLQGKDGTVVASWSFSKILSHWKRKHAKAVYVPSISQFIRGGLRQYHYGNEVRLYEGADVHNLLKAIHSGSVYYDPGIKLENAYTKPKTKRRSQFRVKSAHLDSLYQCSEIIDVLI